MPAYTKYENRYKILSLFKFSFIPNLFEFKINQPCSSGRMSDGKYFQIYKSKAHMHLHFSVLVAVIVVSFIGWRGTAVRLLHSER